MGITKYANASRWHAPPLLPQYVWILTWINQTPYPDRVEREIFVPIGNNSEIPPDLRKAIDELEKEDCSYRVARFFHPQANPTPRLFDVEDHEFDNKHDIAWKYKNGKPRPGPLNIKKPYHRVRYSSFVRPEDAGN